MGKAGGSVSGGLYKRATSKKKGWSDKYGMETGD